VNTLLLDRVDPGIAVVTFNRPERLNAMSGEMMDELQQLWIDLAAEPDLRCVVIIGRGRGFCAGADAGFLSAERKGRGEGAAGELTFVGGSVVDAPFIVAVNGVCAGGGLHFVGDADIVIAAESATFSDPHVSVGQVSGLEPTSMLGRMPVSALLRMALLGRAEKLSAQRAYELGMVTEVVADERILDRALELARLIAGNSPAAVRATRSALRRLTSDALMPYLELGWTDVMAHWAHPDSREGPAAFSEKRQPVWDSDVPGS
jgi:enoyl-CoA hydratase/carnithine racemase